MYTLQLSGYLLRRFNMSYVQSGTRLASSFGPCENYTKFGGYRRRIGVWLREQGVQLGRSCTRQFEFIVAQRIRRSLQIFHLYTRIWDEVALKEFIKSWRYRSLRNSKNFLLSAVGVTMFNWDTERISDDELNSCKQEIDGIHKLKNSTVVCAKCHLRIIIDHVQPGIKYCQCHGTKPSATSNQDSDGWKPFIEREDMLIWRKEEPDTGGLFAYKVYGSFSDVTAEDFLQVQIDVDYRKEWDTTARELQIIDTDPKTKATTNDSTDIIYWEMIWPRLFSNRDYVYQRRWVVDREKGLIIIISKVTQHPDAPTRPGVYRVTTYWSYMVIRPYTEFHQPGIEFALTYFDDPGVNVPSTFTKWVAMTGLPDFLIHMRQASKNYQKYKSTHGTLASHTDCLPLEEEEIIQEKIIGGSTVTTNKTEMQMEEDMLQDQDLVEKGSTFHITEETDEQSDSKEEDNEDSTTNTLSEEDRSLLNSFFFSKLFA